MLVHGGWEYKTVRPGWTTVWRFLNDSHRELLMLPQTSFRASPPRKWNQDLRRMSAFLRSL